MLKIIESLIFTLNKVTVEGEENWDKLLGCIQTLRKLSELIKEAQEKGAAVNETDNQQSENV